MNFYLPEGEVWYNYQTKAQEATVGEWQNRKLTDLQQALFVMGGIVLPMLQHADCMALLSCIENPITLEVYLDAEGYSYGELYIDDGETFDFKTGQSALIAFEMTNPNTLSSSFVQETSYEVPSTKMVTQTMVYGLEKAPTSVHTGSDLKKADFYFDEVNHILYVSDFEAKLGLGTILTIT